MDIPPLPDGFQLDSQPVPPLPDGFELEEASPSDDKQSDLPEAARAFIGFGAGLTGRGVGVIQAGADLVGAKGVSEAASKVKKKIERDVASLGTAGEVGNFVGDVAPALAIPGGAATRASRAALAGVSGAAEGFTRATSEQSNLKDRAEQGLIGLGTGVVASPALEKGAEVVGAVARAGKDVAKGAIAKSPEAWQEIGDGLKAQSQATYTKMREAGAVINKKTVNAMVADLEKAVSEGGKTNADLHRNTLSVLQDLKALKGKTLSLEEADQYRQLLNDVVSTGTDGTGKINPDAMKALNLIDTLDSHIERLGASNIASGGADAAPLLKQARQEWGKYRRFDKVRSLVERYGDTPGVLKNQVRLLLLNKKAMRGFNDAEKEALKRLSQKGGVESWLRFAGRAGIDLKNPAGNVIPLVTGGATALAGDAATGGLVTAGATGARYASQAITRGQAEDALGTLSGLVAPKAAGAGFTAPAATGGLASAVMPGAANDSGPKPSPQPVTVRQPIRVEPVSDKVVDRIISVESNGRADAQNPRSSARGAGQFIKSTWLGLMRGEPEAEGKSAREILALRDDPSISRRMVAKYADQNGKLLAKRGIQPTNGMIYLSHFLDGPVAARLAKAKPDTPAFRIVGADAVKANPTVLKNKTAAQVLAWAERKARVS
jgi:hypothetical protein